MNTDRAATHEPSLSGADDEHVRLSNVRPAHWPTPTPAGRYHLVVIGGGTAGLVSAAIAAGLGARVALIERHQMGGDCLNVGCVPSKALLRSARAWHDARTAADRFGGPSVNGDGDFAAVVARMRRLRAGLSRVDSAARFRELGVDVFFGNARFTDGERVAVTNDDGSVSSLHCRRAIIATGGRAAVPDIPGLRDAGYLTNETIFDVDVLPKKLLVIGAGPIGCELAQAFARFGGQVTILDSGARLLPREDADAARLVAASLAADGITMRTGVTIRSVRTDSAQRVISYEVDGAKQEASGNAILVAAGRAPNLDGLGLEEAGVAHGLKGIVVNDRFRTSNARVYAIGDCASPYQFTHAADAQARRAVANALFFGLGGGKASEIVMPWGTYTSPEVAHTGMTWEEAERAGSQVKALTIPMAEVDRAVLDGEEEGFLRVYLAAGTDRILGATMVAEHAGEIITELTAAIVNGVGLGGLGKTIHPYPTQAEAIRKAADAHSRERLTPRAKRIFALFFGATA